MPTPKNTFGQVRTFDPATVEETRTIPFVFSTASRDGHGTILNQENWKLDRFNGNGIVGYMHNVYGGDLCNAPDPDDVIGAARSWVEDGQLVGELTFETKEVNPKAEKIFRKILAGTLKAVSVGFLPTGEGSWGEGDESQRGINPTYYYEGQELLEISVVNIPSNPDALRRSARNQTANAIAYVHRQLNEKKTYSFADVEAMTVGEVIRLLDGKAEGNGNTPPPPTTKKVTHQMKRRAKYLEHVK